MISRLAARMIEPAFCADEFALSSLEPSPAVHTILPVMRLVFFCGQHQFLHLDGLFLVVHAPKILKWPTSVKLHQPRRRSAMATAFTPHTMLNGSFSVVSEGISRDEW